MRTERRPVTQSAAQHTWCRAHILPHLPTLYIRTGIAQAGPCPNEFLIHASEAPHASPRRPPRAGRSAGRARRTPPESDPPHLRVAVRGSH